MKLKSVNPATEELLGSVLCSRKGDVHAAVLRAAKAGEAWRTQTVDNRIAFLQHVRDEVKKNTSSFVSLLMHEIGKPKIEAEFEVVEVLHTIDYYCADIKKVQTKTIPLDQSVYLDTSAAVEYVPHGVIGLITPWNYPLNLAFWTLVPALLAGNTVVYKPSKHAVLVGKKITEIIQKILPQGVFEMIIGDERIGHALVTSAIDKLFFTGSITAGKDILKRIGIKPAALELGGKDAAIVCSDADLKLAVQGILWGAFTNSGQCCVAAGQVFVEKALFRDFTMTLVEAVKQLRFGKELQPLRNEEQLKKVMNLVADAKRKGAKILLGGNKIEQKGFWFEPTIITGIKPNMKVCTEEIFGPVITVSPIMTAFEAVAHINKSMYGLGVSIWTKNNTYARTITDKINVGMVWVNDVGVPLPGGDYWGGVKSSGLRNTESKLMQCMKAKTFLSYTGIVKREWWYPYS